MYCKWSIERFSVECRKAKTKGITTANQNKGNITRSQSELEVKTNKLPEAWENVSGQGATALRFEFDFLREWCEFSRPITEWGKANLKQSQIPFDT